MHHLDQKHKPAPAAADILEGMGRGPIVSLSVQERRPLLATNANAEHVVGLTRRAFLELLPDLERDGLTVVRRGKLRGVLLDDLEGWLRKPRETRSAAAANETATGDSVLRELGLRRVGGTAR